MNKAPKISRRGFLRISTSAAGSLTLAACTTPETKSDKQFIQTVLGPIHPAELGPSLSHEHIICDFIGANETGRHRWKVDEVADVMRPYLQELTTRNFTGFFDCTPEYIGRDPRILKKLAAETGVHIVTNTGYYGGARNKFVPKHAYSEPAEELAARWILEWQNGIEETGVRPGFIKTGVDETTGIPPALSAIDAKLIRATSIASNQTGLAVVCHTGGGPAGLAAAKLFISEGGTPNQFIVAHSDSHGLHINQQVAALGAWVSFDAISRKPLEQHLKLVSAMLEGHANRILISHDNGWYEAGKPSGGKVRNFNYIPDTFLPALEKFGVNRNEIRRLTIMNPAKAFAISPKS